MPEPEITELEELTASKVSGVATPANGTPWLLLKAGNAVSSDPLSRNPDPLAPSARPGDLSGDEADDMETQLTKATGMGFCGTDCDICDPQFGPLGDFLKARLKAAERNALDDKDFAVPSTRAYPINDATHARNALARVSQHGTPEEKKRVRAAVGSRYPEIDVAKEMEAFAKSPGVPSASVATPKEGGKVMPSGKFGLSGPATVERTASTAARSIGGESSYAPVVEPEAFDHENMPAPLQADGYEAGRGEGSPKAPAEQAAADRLGADPSSGTRKAGAKKGRAKHAREPWAVEIAEVAEKESSWAVVDNPDKAVEEGALDAVKNQGPEAFDTATFDAATAGLTAALNAVNSEAVEQGASKEGRRISAATESKLRAALSSLTEVLGEGAQPVVGPGADSQEDMMTQITQDQLDQYLATAAKQAADKAAKSASKETRKALKKAAKKYPQAGNKGLVDENDVRDGVNGRNPANYVNSIPSGGKVEGRYTNNKADTPPSGSTMKTSKKEDKALKSVADQLHELKEKVEKMAQRPRSGGPVLDGVARGPLMGSEGPGQVAKSEPEAKIEQLKKQLDTTTDPYLKDAVSRELSLEMLRFGHETGQI